MSNIEGIDELLTKLSELGSDIKEPCRKGLECGAKRIQKNAKLLTPVDTGQLRNSIKTNSKATSEGAEAKVFTNAEHAPYVEFGTGQRGQQSNIDRPEGITYKADWKGQAAQPYMSPAYLHAKNTGEVEQEVAKTLQEELRKLGGK